MNQFIVQSTLLAVGLLAGGYAMAADSQPASQAAETIHRQSLVFDSHIDIPYRMQKHSVDIGSHLSDGHFDFVRAKQGGLDASFFVVFVRNKFNRPGSYPEAKGGAYAEALLLIDLIKKAVAANSEVAALAYSPDDVKRIVGAGKHAVVMGMENGAPVEGDLKKLRHFYQLGVRYVTLVHAWDNHICDASYDKRHSHKGLTPFGRELIAEMNRLGMMIDLSHASDDTFWQVLKLTRAPVIASHSNLRVFRDMERNISDKMLRALKANGGVVGITFGSWFLSPKIAKALEEQHERLQKLEKSQTDKTKLKQQQTLIRQEYQQRKGTLKIVVDQIDHAVKIAGVDHVGLGSDFDGVGSTPIGLEDVSCYPNLTQALLRRGYSTEEINKINGGNLMRVWSRVELVADK